MRILIVAFADSIHTARWISQIADQGWDLHLFPSIDAVWVHAEIPSITVHHSIYSRRLNKIRLRQKGIPVYSHRVALYSIKLLASVWRNYHSWQLRHLVHALKPDIVHSLEFQSAGYLTLGVREQFNGQFPKWIATNWGSDMYLFGRLAEHRQRIQAILKLCDYYSCECQRDVKLAQQMGLRGKPLPVVPNTGGFDLQHVFRLRRPGLTSTRRLILVKGYQNWAGRALVALRAIARCGSVLQGYQIAIYLANEDVKLAAELLGQEVGVPVEIVPPCTHDEMLQFFGRARVYIGLSISDAISTSLLEAMVMGAFPIQSYTSCAAEWVIHQKSALLVPPEDPDIVSDALRLALTDDNLVDSAAVLNEETARLRLDENNIRPQVIEMYQSIYDQIRTNH